MMFKCYLMSFKCLLFILTFLLSPPPLGSALLKGSPYPHPLFFLCSHRSTGPSCLPRFVGLWRCWCALLVARPSEVDPVCTRLCWPLALYPASVLLGLLCFIEGPTALTLSLRVLVDPVQTYNSLLQRGHPQVHRSHTGTCLLWLYR